MVNEFILPRDLPAADDVLSDAKLVVDGGVTVQSATPKQIVDAGRPFATEPQAIDGTDNETTMTPLTTRQAIDADTSGTVAAAEAARDKAQEWAESPTAPGDPGTKSAKTWAGEAADLLAEGFYTKSNILGTVSQSGGVPTGAIIERGSNPQGEFVKYADGTMICWGGTEFPDIAAQQVPYPSAFSAVPNVSCSAGRNQFISAGATNRIRITACLASTASTTTSTRMIVDNNIGDPSMTWTGVSDLVDIEHSEGRTYKAEYIAIGRWF